MSTVYASDGTSWQIPKVKPITLTATHLVAPDGKTSLHTTNTDGAHLLLHGTLTGNDLYIKCQDDNSAVKFSVDSSGEIHSNGRDVNAELQALTDCSVID